MTQKLRADAQDNRERILEAARQLFAEHGMAVSIRDVARQAGVGPATLYRRFPTRQALVADVFAGELAACRMIVERGRAAPDPWQGLRYVVAALIRRNAGSHAFIDAIALSSQGGDAVVEHRRQLIAMLHDLLGRAKDKGLLRADITTDDVVLALIAGRAVGSVDAVKRNAAADRFATLILDAFRRGPEPQALASETH